ncbi:MAG TPA: nucleotidyltransferase domain-containing protein [Candidatus Nanoarchaeia archaeon]|nr:nucleotidyltransferase domain-containing protein [Candidatus Nanoarchaeia archaeon]
MFLETMLGSKAKVKILRVLAEIRTAFTLQDLKNETELSIGIIHQSLQDLTEEGVVQKMKGTKKERLFKFNTNHPLAHHLFEAFRIEKTVQRKEVILLHTWNVLENAVAKLKEKSHLILLFGSHARGNATLRSDIDILIISKNTSSEINTALQEVKSKDKINPTILSAAAFKEEMKKNTLFFKNIKSDSIILYVEPDIPPELYQFLMEMGHKGEEN